MSMGMIIYRWPSRAVIIILQIFSLMIPSKTRIKLNSNFRRKKSFRSTNNNSTSMTIRFHNQMLKDSGTYLISCVRIVKLLWTISLWRWSMSTMTLQHWSPRSFTIELLDSTRKFTKKSRMMRHIKNMRINP